MTEDKSKHNILLVMDGTRTHYIDALSAANFDVLTADSAFFALTLLERTQIDVIVSAETSIDMSGYDLYDIVRSDESFARSMFVLLGDLMGQPKSQNDMFFPANVTPDALARTLAKRLYPEPEEAQPSKTANSLGSGLTPPSLTPPPEKHPAPSKRSQPVSDVSGTLEMFSLFDLTIMISQSSKTGYIQLRFSEDDATVYLNEGRIIHAVMGQLIGEAALREIFVKADEQAEAEFNFYSDLPNSSLPTTIHMSAEEVLLQVVVALDEARAGKVA